MSKKNTLHTVFNALIDELKPQNLIAEQCRFADGILTVQETDIDLAPFRHIHLLGSGKAVIPMAEVLRSILGERVESTLLVGAYQNAAVAESVRYIQSSHPLPSTKSVEAATALREQMLSLQEDDFFIYLLSGGNSALVELPESPITLEEFQATTALMLQGGMPIEAMNCVRKHLSQVKGGKLAQGCKANGIVLVLSDVIGDDLHAIGSAPLYFDTTTFEDAVVLLKEYSLFEIVPQSVQHYLSEGSAGRHLETPKAASEKIRHFVLGSNTHVLNKAKMLLENNNVPATIVAEPIKGDTQVLAEELVDFAENYRGERHCFIFGGEATVNVRGEGRGGRNQHLALSVLQRLEGHNDITFLSAATDGIDGNSDAAGALIDMHSRVYALSHEIDPSFYLETFDSNAFFSKTGELLITGPTHNNLLDIVMILIEPTFQKGEN